MFDINPLEYRVGVTVEAEQDQKRTNTRRHAQHRPTTRNFPVVAEKYWTLGCIKPAVDGVREFPGNPLIAWHEKSKKAAPPGFPNQNSLFRSPPANPDGAWIFTSSVIERGLRASFACA